MFHHEHDEHTKEHLNNNNNNNKEEDINEDELETKDDENDEVEEKNFIKVNDIINPEEKKDVDLSSFFYLSKLWVFKELFKKNTLDLKNNLKVKLNLSFKPIIKILKLSNNFDNIKASKKNKPVYINDYIPEIDENSINLLDIENFYNEKGPFSDIQKPKKTLNKIINTSIKSTKKKIKKIDFVKFWISVFLLTSFLFTYLLFLKYEISKTFEKIQNFELHTDIKKINKNLLSVKRNLIFSNILLKPIFFANFIFGSKDIYNLNYLLKWISFIVDFSIDALIVYDWVNNLILKKWVDEIMYSQLIDNIEPILWKMNNNINSSISSFEKIKNLSDDNLNNIFFEKLDKIKVLQKYFNIFYENKDTFKQILWDKKKKTYVIIFQNNDEIRPTWGFMWSMWFIDIYKWKILNFNQKDIYALEWELKDFAKKNWVAFEEKSPKWLDKLSTTFWLRDANYYYDIKESSEKIKSFLDKTNYKIDGIIYINQNLVLNALNEFGWVYFEDIKKEINDKNFSLIISTLVETKYSKTHTLSTPKQVLFDFAWIFFKKIKNDKNYLWYIKLFLSSIEKKDIIFWSFTENENQFLKEIWLINTDNFTKYFDFNYPVFTSISGNKSDRYIKRTFEKNIFQNPDCSINTTLKIKQKHGFNIQEEINIKNFLYDMDLLGKVDLENTLKIQWKWVNKQFIRVLLPKNANILNKDVKISEKNDYKEVSFYLETKPLFESNFEINYILKNTECKNYNYEFIKQPWIKNYNLIINKNWNLIDSLYTDKNYTLNN